MKQQSQVIRRVQKVDNYGDEAVKSETVIATQQVNEKDLFIAKVNQFIWLAYYVVSVILCFRILFLFFGARLTGVVLWVYQISNPLVQPFLGVFRTPSVEGAYIDSNAILAIFFYYVVSFVITYALSLFLQNLIIDEQEV